MKASTDTVAFITGGAQGIGLAIARALGKRGAKIMLADINQEKLSLATDTLAAENIEADKVVCDVADAASMHAAAMATIDRFGGVHILVNNAGVAVGGLSGAVDLADWRWIIDINLMGVVHGVETFLPIMQRQGQGGHIVNVASMSGHLGARGLAPYTATKFAVVGYSECIQQDLADTNIGVSVLCPGWVKTEIHTSHMARPSADKGKKSSDHAADAVASTIGSLVESGFDPDLVGEWVCDCIESDRFYIFTHPDMSMAVSARAAAIKADYEACIADGRFAGPGE